MDVFTALPQKYSNGRAGLLNFSDVGLRGLLFSREDGAGRGSIAGATGLCGCKSG
jgi:hypothetical protein